MRDMAESLDKFLNGELEGDNRRYGFCLFVFEFGTGPGRRMNYVSNCKRLDMKVMFQEQLRRMEGMVPDEEPEGVM